MERQGSGATDRWIYGLSTPSVLEHSSICLVGLLLAAGSDLAVIARCKVYRLSRISPNKGAEQPITGQIELNAVNTSPAISRDIAQSFAIRPSCGNLKS
jgi:hypothetical protein